MRQGLNFYLLADSRLAEAHDTGTVELLAGAARSAPKTLPDSKLPHSQNLSGEVKDGRKREASTDTLYQKDDQGKWAPGDHTSRARSEYNVTQDWVYDLLAGPSDSLPAETRGEEQNQAKAKGGVKSEGIGVYFHQAETKA